MKTHSGVSIVQEFLLQICIYKQMVIDTGYNALIFIPWMLLLKVLLTINNNI
jgi:hypothetical protein